jgi:BirA family biotin operon repressor/biotin-[acetyl-CoA-carboxylase] ligase
VAPLFVVGGILTGFKNPKTMILLTDNIAFANQCIPQSEDWQACKVSTLASPQKILAGELFQSDSLMRTEIVGGDYWEYLFAVDCASQSQFDLLSRLAVSGNELPDRTLCCAGSGEQFHGFKNRSWEACRGNIHLSAYLEPGKEIPGGSAGFTIAAVIATLQAVDSFNLQDAVAAIKWVNDILVQGAKVGGVLARLQTQASVTQRAMVGIGLNVEQSPPVERDPHVPKVAALSDFADAPEACCHPDVFPRLIKYLGRNLESLCQGNFALLLDVYRRRSLILGREVTIYEDSYESSSDVIATGMVESIGPALELFLKDHPNPVTKGRLIL